MSEPRSAYERNEPHPHPLTLRASDLAARLGVSTRHIHNLRNDPNPARRLPTPFRLGRATFWRFADIEAWIDRQAAASPAA